MYMYLIIEFELRFFYLNKCILLERLFVKRLSLDLINGLGMKRIFFVYINFNFFRIFYGILIYRRDYK